MYQCFHCRGDSVVWDSDSSFEDYGEEGEGVIIACHCQNCGAQILYKISTGKED